ncbi:MAG: hypothetical protein LBD10_02490 [Desulfobulbus sp.]|uniref:hypothetical protein n=1 Tax=Desulfobulbus sp. TaxID=895 RepID=UPI00284F1A15|nr:hypothetical protein [Desulfobulbus sp.]MDR2549064.1 hypothetical protein [Desulfobulbus sp.]
MEEQQLRENLQRRLAILRDELSGFPEEMRMDPKQLLREAIEQDLAIAEVDGNRTEMARCEIELSLLAELDEPATKR